MKEYIEQLRAQMLARQSESPPQSTLSPRVVKLAEQINAWHDKRTVPERWNPVMLGRIAALFGVTRELAAAGMQYAGWKENRTGNASMWQPSINLINKEK